MLLCSTEIVPNFLSGELWASPDKACRGLFAVRDVRLPLSRASNEFGVGCGEDAGERRRRFVVYWGDEAVVGVGRWSDRMEIRSTTVLLGCTYCTPYTNPGGCLPQTSSATSRYFVGIWLGRSRFLICGGFVPIGPDRPPKIKPV
jgi:hypothetical protein